MMKSLRNGVDSMWSRMTPSFSQPGADRARVLRNLGAEGSQTGRKRVAQCRTLVWLIAVLAGMVALPVCAQQRNNRLPDTLNGKVLSVDDRGRQLTVALYVRYPDANAPGKVPDEMAQAAARLLAQATQLERRGEMDKAGRNRAQADELLRWREIERAISATNRNFVIGVQRIPLQQIPTGIRIRLQGSVEGDIPPGVLPERISVNGDATQVGPRTPVGFRNLPPVPRVRKTFFSVVGNVTSVSPLALSLGNRAVLIDAMPHAGLVVQTPVTPQDIAPGMDIRARVRMISETEIGDINRLLILIHKPEAPLDPKDDV